MREATIMTERLEKEAAQSDLHNKIETILKEIECNNGISYTKNQDRTKDLFPPKNDDREEGSCELRSRTEQKHHKFSNSYMRDVRPKKPKHL